MPAAPGRMPRGQLRATGGTPRVGGLGGGGALASAGPAGCWGLFSTLLAHYSTAGGRLQGCGAAAWACLQSSLAWPRPAGSFQAQAQQCRGRGAPPVARPLSLRGQLAARSVIRKLQQWLRLPPTPTPTPLPAPIPTTPGLTTLLQGRPRPATTISCPACGRTTGAHVTRRAGPGMRRRQGGGRREAGGGRAGPIIQAGRGCSCHLRWRRLVARGQGALEGSAAGCLLRWEGCCLDGRANQQQQLGGTSRAPWPELAAPAAGALACIPLWCPAPRFLPDPPCRSLPRTTGRPPRAPPAGPGTRWGRQLASNISRPTKQPHATVMRRSQGLARLSWTAFSALFARPALSRVASFRLPRPAVPLQASDTAWTNWLRARAESGASWDELQVRAPPPQLPAWSCSALATRVASELSAGLLACGRALQHVRMPRRCQRASCRLLPCVCAPAPEAEATRPLHPPQSALRERYDATKDASKQSYDDWAKTVSLLACITGNALLHCRRASPGMLLSPAPRARSAWSGGCSAVRCHAVPAAYAGDQGCRGSLLAAPAHRPAWFKVLL